MPRKFKSHSSPSLEKEEKEAKEPALFFYGHSPNQPYNFFSQHYTHSFPAALPFQPSDEEPKIIAFTSTEQYMMYAKAVLFHDLETAEEILATAKPEKQKALGRQVTNFDDKIWKQHREKIVEEGNWWKFKAGDEGCEECARMRAELLATGERELVEASPPDKSWGIGFGKENAEANRGRWGLNLLGKALMRVRERLRKEEAQEKMDETEYEVAERVQ